MALPGHSSRPLPIDSTANGQLIGALGRLTAYETPVQLSEATRSYLHSPWVIRGLAGLPMPSTRCSKRKSPEEQARRVRALVSLESGGWGIEGSFAIRSSTMINSGVEAERIPGTAEAVLNARLLPGNTVDDFIQELKDV